MSNNYYSVDFLNINKSKKLFAWTHGVILTVFILNSAMAGVFMIAPPALACHGGITIIKDTGNECSPDFDFMSTGPEAPGAFSLSGGEEWADSYMQSGTYIFSEENIPAGWYFDRIECSGGDTSIDGQSVTINLSHEDAVECTFFNTEEETGRDDCVDELGPDYFTVAKWEWSGSAYSLDPGSVAPAYNTNVSGTAVTADWTSDPRVAAVISKEATNYFEHPGGTSGTVTKTGQQDISHISLCGGPPSTGSITVCKYEDENGDGDKDIEDGPIADWTVYAGQEALSTEENGCVTFEDLAFDTYTISEDMPLGWTQTYPGLPGTHSVTLDAQNPFGVVSFLNHEDCPPPTGSITICKYYDNGVIGEYEELIDTPLQWPFIIEQGATTVAEFSTADNQACVTIPDLPYGDYSVNELPIAGGYWINSLPGSSGYNVTIEEECSDKHLTFLNYQNFPPGPGSITVCKYEDADGLASTTGDRVLITDTAWTFTIGSVSQDTIEGCTTFTDLAVGNYNVVETPQTDWTAVDPVSGELIVSLAAEEHKTVNFSNYKDETTTTLIVKKMVVGGEAIPSDWTMHIADVTSFPGSSAGTATTVGAGMYQITETGTPDNYLLTYSGDCGSEGHVTIAEGETRTCILTNTYHIPPPQIGHLIVYKHVIGGEATSSDWTMHVGDSVEFPGTATGEDRGYEADTYIVSESDGPANYILTFSGDCNATGSVEVIAGETKECILTNTYDPPPVPFCGDGNLDEGEQCDDGNNVSGDGCSATCTTEGGGGGGGGGVIYLQILYLEAHCLTADSAVVNWRTNKTATSWVVYGIDSDDIEDATSTEVTSASTNHSVIIDGLTPEVDYSFEAISREGSREVKKTVTYNTNACVITEGEEGEPILTIVKSIAKEFVNPGDTGVEYTVIVTNIGNLTSFDTVLVDALPTGLTFSDNGENIKTWELGDMIPGESKEITYLVDVAPDAAPMSYINTAKVSSSNHEEISDIADVDIRTVEVLAVTGFDLSELISLVMVITMLFGMGWFVRQGLREERK